MSTALNSLNTQLEDVLRTLKSEPVNSELQKGLHDHSEGALPDPELSKLASRSIDLLHEIEQMLEPGHLVLADHFLGYVHAKCLVSAVQFGVADALDKNGPMTITPLASACSARPDRLSQVLRVLISNGIFAYDRTSKTYTNNHTSTLLLSSHWTQWHRWATLYGTKFYDMARGIPCSLRDDALRSPAQINYNTDLNMFKYFESQGWVPQLHATLGAGATAQAPGILADYPWVEVEDETIMDIGGGGGGFVAMLMRAHKALRGGIFDQPHVIEYAKPLFHAPGGQFADIGAQVPIENLVGGDFFDKIPPSKVYTMKWTLHDWRDEDARRILRNIEKAILPGENSRLIILEAILDTTRSARLSRYGDMNMMIAADGVERTWDEWVELADSAGWVITKVYPLRNAWHCAFDLVPKSWQKVKL
ncbi:S-adenosyl-L-methionine-dependent methyltransferase [Corynespora cassiicola Philippines]|uniref:S-adenosyl-L-methionine-dependent methyltransferase n=1 Tax=Corynespora cassiicola Philippines TaxID=1448308 RepID=A0A2T2NNP7_CORCC|nr:S-adenosyl-L-methionine-dependent methyltransferase [Corynespora cassiicola Philippines]